MLSAPQIKKTLRLHKDLFLGFLAFVFLATALLILFAGLESKNPANEQASENTKNTQQPNGPVFGIWATIDEVKAGSKQGEGSLKVSSDLDEKITLNIDNSVLIYPKLETTDLKQRLAFETLKKEQRIYFSSTNDLRGKKDLKAGEYQMIEVVQ